MARQYAQRIKNEEEIFSWAREKAEKLDPELRSKYYKAVQPKIFREEMADLGLTEESEIRTVESVLARAAVSGTWGDNLEFSDEKFIKYMDEFYLPRAKFFHEESTGWFKLRMKKAEPTLFSLLEQYGVDWEGVSYEGNQGTKTVYSAPTSIGVIVILFDPSKNTFEIVGD